MTILSRSCTRFLSRVFGARKEGSRSSNRRLAAGRGSQFGCEMLEGRALLSIAGVKLDFGRLAITATKASGNVAEVSVNPTTHNIKVTLNGKSEEFAAKQVGSVVFTGGANGHDKFTNNTNLLQIAYGYGGHNTFTGGNSTYNMIYLHGGNNTYTAKAHSTSNVYEIGANDVVHQGTGAKVKVTTYPSWMWALLD
jgi:hypothetical protein